MKEILITSWSQLRDEFDNFKYQNWVFRGQSDSHWNLENSFSRFCSHFDKIVHLNDSKVIGVDNFIIDRFSLEHELIDTFKKSVHLFLNPPPPFLNNLDILSIMQHYGTPTRLLDVTHSPYIALHFATEQGIQDCCVIGFNPEHFKKIDDNLFNEASTIDMIFKEKRGEDSFFITHTPSWFSSRIKAQQGLFLVPSTLYENFDQIILNYFPHNDAAIKFIIPANLRLTCMVNLLKKNINSSTLFPDLDGFCKSLRNEIFQLFFKTTKDNGINNALNNTIP
jgi:hypothetical protein